MCEVAQKLISEGKQLGIQEGLQEGRQLGIQEGLQLYNYLISEHRESDLEKCLSDKKYLISLLEELDF